MDLTQPSNYPFGEDVFSGAVQRQRLPRTRTSGSSRCSSRARRSDASLADSVALAMKEWALKGAHSFHPRLPAAHQPHRRESTTRSSAPPATAWRSPDTRAQADPRRSRMPPRSRPAAYARPSRRAGTPRGTHEPGVPPPEPERRAPASPTAFVSWTGEALDTKIPLLARWAAVRPRRSARLKLLVTTKPPGIHHGGSGRSLPDRPSVLLQAP